MRFSMAWAQTAAQNVSLKVAVVALSVTASVLAVVTVKLAVRKPLIIERTCYDHAVDSTSGDHTQSEVEAFLRETIQSRFDSDAHITPSYLSESEESARAAEQKELSSRGMTQTVIFRSLEGTGSAITVMTDRLVSVAQIRSAFPFPLSVSLASVDRTAINPYGLQIVEIRPIQTPQGSGDKK